MLRNGHVRFGGRPAETHQFKDWQGAAGRPYTEHHTNEGKLYMCAVKDVFSNRIVGYAIDARMKSRLAVEAIDDAVARRGGAGVVAGCVVHSDRGSQFRSRKFQQTLRHYGLVVSRVRLSGRAVM
ncbi:transposase InsO family protein [Brevibacterium luteolum]|nr:transposase InsO family protein [Brevibacterium luteolum]